MSAHWNAAVQAAIEVGDAVAAMRGPLDEEIRADRFAAQAKADRFAHDRLNELLRAAYPDVPVISEEDAEHESLRPDSYWLIDPIDGTASWSSGYPGFVCQLARIEGGVVTFGVIHAPVLQTVWTAMLGDGAYRNGERLSALSPLPYADDEIVVVDNYAQPRGICARLMDWLGSENYVESGSIGLKAVLVASGEADLFVKDVVVRDWDVAPAMAVMREVGGFCARFDGSEFALNGPYEKTDGVVFARTEVLGTQVTQWLAGQEPDDSGAIGAAPWLEQ